MILDEIVADKREQLFRDKQKTDLTVMRTLAEEKLREEAAKKENVRSFYQNLAKDGLSIIGEFKNASPSLGKIESRITLEERMEDYTASVDAVSCLTEEKHFLGNTDYFRKVRNLTPLPMLRKDFMIEEYQFYEAKAIDADAVLLIAAILDDKEMYDFYQLAKILDEIVADKREQLFRDKQKTDLTVMRTLAEEKLREEAAKKENVRSFYQNLAKDGLSIIGEFKNASPSLGKIESRITLEERMEDYTASVDAVSCLTEEKHFLGNTDYFRKVRNLTPLPMLRKDFMIEEYQFYEAKAIDADAVLLIAAILDDKEMYDFYQLAKELKLDVLVETHDEWEMERALKLDADIIGINNRNLKDFTISLERTKTLSKMVPKDKLLIAESGIVRDDDVAYLADCGVSGFLIGRAFMEHENPKALAAHWKQVYKEAAK